MVSAGNGVREMVSGTFSGKPWRSTSARCGLGAGSGIVSDRVIGTGDLITTRFSMPEVSSSACRPPFALPRRATVAQFCASCRMLEEGGKGVSEERFRPVDLGGDAGAVLALGHGEIVAGRRVHLRPRQALNAVPRSPRGTVDRHQTCKAVTSGPRPVYMAPGAAIELVRMR
jgi:hypothetical protein